VSTLNNIKMCLALSSFLNPRHDALRKGLSLIKGFGLWINDAVLALGCS
jgi:hypothetical protein